MSNQPPPAYPSSSDYYAQPQTYLVWSILNLIFCCLPFGIVALVFSIQCQSAINSSRPELAEDYSQKARGWNIAATSVGAVAIIIGIIVFAAGAHSASNG